MKRVKHFRAKHTDTWTWILWHLKFVVLFRVKQLNHIDVETCWNVILSKVKYENKLQPDFALEVKYLFNASKVNCYEGFVVQHFTILEDAKKYISWKRPLFPQNYCNDGTQTSQITKFRFAVEQIIDYIAIESVNIYNFFYFEWLYKKEFYSLGLGNRNTKNQ